MSRRAARRHDGAGKRLDQRPGRRLPDRHRDGNEAEQHHRQQAAEQCVEKAEGEKSPSHEPLSVKGSRKLAVDGQPPPAQGGPQQERGRFPPSRTPRRSRS